MKKIQTLLLMMAFLQNASQAAIVLTAGTTYTQNFNSMGTSLTLPADWQITFNDEFTNPSRDPYLDSSSTLSFEATGGTPTTPGTYSFATTGGLDRAVGVIPDRSGASTRSSLIVARFQVTDPAITQLQIGYNLESYYIGNYPSNSIMGLYSSSQSITNWKAARDTAPKANRAGHYFTSRFENVVLTPTDFGTGDLYLIFQFNGMGSDGLALDNFSITAVPEPASAILLLSGSLLALRRKRPAQC
jgi:hypothetical protein